MNRAIAIWYKVKLLAVTAGLWLAVDGVALAQRAAKQAGDGGGGDSHKVWVMPYALVMLCIGLGMLVVCRSSRRSDRAKPKKYGE